MIKLESKICLDSVKAAGSELKNFQKNNNFKNIEKWNKFEAGLVTQADLKSDEIIKKIIKKNSNHNILSEESRDDFSLSSDKFFCVDPLCGTVPYSNNLNSWGLTVSFFSDNKSVGAIGCPANNEYIHCDDENVYFNDEIFKPIASFPEMIDMTLCLEIEQGKNWSKLFKEELDWVKNFSYINSFASAVYPGFEIIKGNLPVMAIYKISLEHVGGLMSIGEKIGLKSTDGFGNDLKTDKLINEVPEWFIFGWPEVHEKLIEKINN
ncbi:MAG: hypothetical protein CL769_04680 [Chloroflexi bacterium]|nr:hypothetical protein [Chloroflexota bacterium]